MKNSKSRLTIGILSNSLDYEYQILVWAGVQDAAKEVNANTICFSGSEINSPNILRNERNTVYEMISDQNIDGLILIPSVTCSFMSPEEITSFFDKYKHIPMISIGLNLKNIPSIIIDNKFGFKYLIDHLIEMHGYKKFLYVGGPVKSIEAQERLKAFNESLNEHGIKIKPEHITVGNFFLHPTRSLVLDILNRGERFDAILTANDNMAMGAIRALQEKNINFPDEIAVIGFDDIKSASALLIPLTTVRQPVFEMAKKAVSTLIKRINGEKVLDLEKMKTEPIIRRSCGCLSDDINHVSITDLELSFLGVPDYKKIKESIMNEIKKDLLGGNDKNINIYSLIAENFIKFIQDKISDKDFILELDRCLKKSVQCFFNNSVWIKLFFLFRKKILPFFFNKPEMIIRIEDLMYQSRILINNISKQIEKKSFLRLSERTKALQRIMGDLANSFNVKILLEKMVSELPKIGISSCYLSLHSSDEKMFKEAKLILAYNKKGKIKLDKNGFLFPAEQLFPRDLIKLKERFDLIIEALYYEKEQLGFILMEYNPFKGILITSISDQIRSAIKSSMLLEETIEKGKFLENALFELKQNQTRLLISEKMASLGKLTAGIAHEINTPLATARASLSEMIDLIKEYKESLSHPEITIKDHYDISNDMKKAVNITNKAIEKSIDFVKSIKSRTRKSDDKERINFNAVEIINESILLLSHILKKSNLSIDFKYSNKNILLYGLPGKFSQVITNLVLNAIDAMDGKKNKNIKIILNEEKKKIILKVIDRGKGIPKSIITKIFDPLFTSKPFGKGTGLGLTIVHDVVYTEYSGKIEVESKIDSGTTFTIIFEKPESTKE